jgi:putative oligomerization/nucleic acid binding protein
MFRGLMVGVWLILASAGVGCGGADRAELEKIKTELAELRAKKNMPAEKPPAYLDELERLETLRAKGVLTQEEFESKKKAALGASPKPEPPPSSMDELAKRLRTIQGLYNSNVITNVEMTQQKNKLIDSTLVLTDLKKDLETVQALYNGNIISNVEHEKLKKRLLEMDSAKK